jgi:3-deoxy-D-manno-octulosonic-acid transferase
LISFFYTLSIRIYTVILTVAAAFHPKAKAWVDGRKNWEGKLKKNLSTLDSAPIWFHCASYGEYLQALPLIKALHKKYTSPIVVSFFSPSGFQNYKTIPEIYTVFYLPIDTKQNAKTLCNILKPTMFIGVKYDIWPNLQAELKRNDIPQILIAAQFRSHQIYFKPWGRFFKRALTSFNPIFTQYPSGKKVLDEHKIDNILVGDPRFDQALENKNTPYKNDSIVQFLDGQKALIFGSAWQEEVEIAMTIHAQHPEQKIIIAPHEIEKSHLKNLFSAFENSISFLSDLKPRNNILIIDSVGELRYLYRYGKMAIVAGGFTGKLHNIIEPLAYGLPVVIGNQHTRFPEADYALKNGAALEGKNTEDLANKLSTLLQSPDDIGRMSKNATYCVNEKSGATQSVLNHPIFETTLRKTT